MTTATITSEGQITIPAEVRLAMSGFVPLAAVVELVWVLSSCFGLDRSQVSRALDALLRARQLVVDQADQVLRAVLAYAPASAESANSADCLIERAAAAGCTRTMAFDVSASKTAGMTLIR